MVGRRSRVNRMSANISVNARHSSQLITAISSSDRTAISDSGFSRGRDADTSGIGGSEGEMSERI